MAVATAETLSEAARVLGIKDNASMHDIRSQYREQLKKWHPDTSQKNFRESHEMTILLNEAYNLLIDYCMNYKFSFRLEDLNKNVEKNPAELWMERYGNDPIWG